MSISPEEWQKEEERVEEVVLAVKKKLNSMHQHLTSLKTDIIDIRKNFWEDVRVNVDEPHELIETFTTIKQQAEFLSERERSHGHGNYLQTRLTKLKQSPYFGRIDFLFEGEQKSESVYLGIASFLNEKDEFLIYDWRAPISSLYYDSLPGPAKYKTPSGIVFGSLALKRQFIIKNGLIEGMFDTGLAIGDELLREVLGQHSDSQMRTIVSTIQKEQNSIIRNESSKFLVVQGAAGSGKTSAALQRVAYLLYRYRETLDAENILLFSPNQLFKQYISSVLPELGEKNMMQTTFHDFLHNKVGGQMEIEDPFTQMEYTLSSTDEEGYKEKIKGIQFKSSNSFLELLQHYIKLLGNEGLLFHDIQLKGRILISSKSIQEKFYEYDSSLPISNRLKLLTDHLLQELKDLAKKEIKEKWVEDEIQYLDKETYLKAYQNLQQKNKKQFSDEAFNDLALEQRFLSKLVVKVHFRPIIKIVRSLRYIDLFAIYIGLFTNSSCQQLVESLGVNLDEWKSICLNTIQTIEQGTVNYEDATPFVYLKEQMEGLHKNTSVRHVFVDEAQDYSVLQLELLTLLFPKSRFTLLGDLNQAIFIHTTHGSPFHSFSSNNVSSTEIIKLTRSYRSTRPIVEFTRELVVGGDPIIPFNRKGNLPIITEAKDKVSLHQTLSYQIQSLSEIGTTNVAVICKTYAESQHAFELLKDTFPIRLLKKESSIFEPGLVVIPSYLAKGIEFDAVIIYDASVYRRESERNLFYTACTRAMHELYVNYVGEMSPFLTSVNDNLYEKNSKKPAPI
ncbi:RNA polymerase recycling motor HelD [Bacillus sp. DJP31]|uniref:RNA polymerase recycling motor HelD n=1 Tax=Bacillus sp. DJP31 TaxID=3409789 RepID=UPI003BB8146D